MLNRVGTKIAQERKARVCAWATNITSRPFIVLDTETTGLGQDAEIVEIALVGHDGKALLDTLIKPQGIINDAVIAIHGITNEMVLTAPNFTQVYPQLAELVCNQQVIIYNAAYDLGRLRYMTQMCHLPVLELNAACLMKQYATYYGEAGYSNSFRWQKLEQALRQMGIATSVQGQRHRALDDAQQTWRLLCHLADIGQKGGQV